MMPTHYWLTFLVAVFFLGWDASDHFRSMRAGWRRANRVVDAGIALAKSTPSVPTLLDPYQGHAVSRPGRIPTQPTASSVSFAEHTAQALRAVDGGDLS